MWASGAQTSVVVYAGGNDMMSSEEIQLRAAEFVRRLEADDFAEDDWAALTAWLEAGQAHRDAFENAQLAWETTAVGEHELAAILALAPDPIEAADRQPVREVESTTLMQRVRDWFAQPVFGMPRPALASLSAFVIACLALGITMYSIMEPDRSQTFITQIGETKRITLADGSHLQLNTATELTVDVGADARSVSLQEGEAFFDIARDPEREFRITVGDRIVAVLGTQFNVKYVDGRLDIDVVEGLVEVRASEGADAFRLRAGEGVSITDSGITDSGILERRSSPSIGWLQGRLVFENAPLSEIASDLDRYFVQDLSAKNLTDDERYTGVIFIEDLDAVLDQLKAITEDDVRYDEAEGLKVE